LKVQVARLLGEVGAFEKARVLVESTEEGERDEEVLYLLAYYCFKSGKHEDAIDWLTEIDAMVKQHGLEGLDPSIMEAKDELEQELANVQLVEETNEDGDDWMDLE
jgi:hypothetical protein